METVVRVPKGVCAPSEIGTIGAFFQDSMTSEKSLDRSDEKLVLRLVALLDKELISALQARSAQEFDVRRDDCMPRYVRALRALHDTMSNFITDAEVVRLSDVVMTELSDDLQNNEPKLGDKLTEQALFTLYTVGRIRSLAQQIVAAGDAPSDKKGADTVLLYEYHSASLWSQFHLDLVFASIKWNLTIHAAIRDEVCEGLRSAVNAFAIMKDALYLRQPRHAEEVVALVGLPWDEEDEQLLAESMKDINADL